MPQIQKASELGLKIVTYVLAFIFLCNKEEELKDKGGLILVALINEVGMECIIRFRWRFRRMMSTVWIRSRLNLVTKTPIFCKTEEVHSTKFNNHEDGDY